MYFRRFPDQLAYCSAYELCRISVPEIRNVVLILAHIHGRHDPQTRSPCSRAKNGKSVFLRYNTKGVQIVDQTASYGQYW